MDGRGATRAADSDRAALAERLRVALDEGRLDLYEYDERLQLTYAARTYAELDVLVADLPGGSPVVPATTTPAVPPGATRRWLAHVWGDYLSTVALAVAIWAVSALLAGDLYHFWPGWVAGPWGVVLLVTTVTGLTRGEPVRWAAKQERRRRRRKARKSARRERSRARKSARREGSRARKSARDGTDDGARSVALRPDFE